MLAVRKNIKKHMTLENSPYSLGCYFLELKSVLCCSQGTGVHIPLTFQRNGETFSVPSLLFIWKAFGKILTPQQSLLQNAKSAWRIPATVSKTTTDQIQIIQTKSSGWVQGMQLPIHALLSSGWEGRRNMPLPSREQFSAENRVSVLSEKYLLS